MEVPHGVPVFSDGVVILNGYCDGDIAAHLAGEDEETARRFGWWPRRSTEATVAAAFARWAADWESGGLTRAFAVRAAATGCLVGGCELRIQPGGSGHVSYWTGSAHRGNGYATHALSLLCRYAASIGIAQLEAHVAASNLASRRVAENAGFTIGGRSDDQGEPMIRYANDLPTSGDAE
ncbi:MAG: GNAT family N-acetyltransferase [Actinobacteria bacterium]|nr:GNAT family N-acetyltransferase [Actinomycetota bacterium]